MMDTSFRELRNSIRSTLDVTSAAGDSELMEHIEARVFRHSGLLHLTSGEKHALIRRLYDSFRGLDVLQPLIDNPHITEIMINGHTEIFIEERGKCARHLSRLNRKRGCRISSRRSSPESTES